MNTLSRMLLLFAIVALAGCYGTVGDNPEEVEQKAVPAKAMLEQVAESGQLGSASQEIRDALEAMKSSGDANADGLLSDLDELNRLEGKPAALKKKAAEMAAKL